MSFACIPFLVGITRQDQPASIPVVLWPASKGQTAVLAEARVCIHFTTATWTIHRFLKLTVNPRCAVPYRILKTVVKVNHLATFFLTHSQRKFPLRYMK